MIITIGLLYQLVNVLLNIDRITITALRVEQSYDNTKLYFTNTDTNYQVTSTGRINEKVFNNYIRFSKYLRTIDIELMNIVFVW